MQKLKEQREMLIDELTHIRRQWQRRESNKDRFEQIFKLISDIDEDLGPFRWRDEKFFLD